MQLRSEQRLVPETKAAAAMKPMFNVFREMEKKEDTSKAESVKAELEKLEVKKKKKMCSALLFLQPTTQKD